MDRMMPKNKKVEKLNEQNELAFRDLVIFVDLKSATGKTVLYLIKNSKMGYYIEGNCFLSWDHLVEKYVPKSAPLLLTFKKQFENSCLKCTTDDPNAWIMELEDLCN